MMTCGAHTASQKKDHLYRPAKDWCWMAAFSHAAKCKSEDLD